MGKAEMLRHTVHGDGTGAGLQTGNARHLVLVRSHASHCRVVLLPEAHALLVIRVQQYDGLHSRKASPAAATPVRLPGGVEADRGVFN